MAEFSIIAIRTTSPIRKVMSTKYLPVRRSTMGPIRAATAAAKRRADQEADRPGHAEAHDHDGRAVGTEAHEGRVA